MNILIVDDERDVKPLFEQGFRKEIRSGSLQLFFAYSGEEALELLERRPPEYAIILSDINMPGMSGFELLERIRTNQPNVKVIMITAYGDPDSHQKAKTLGASDFLSKPLDFRRLREQLAPLVSAR